MVKIFIDEKLKANVVAGAYQFIKRYFNFDFDLISSDENRLMMGNIIITDNWTHENDYIFYPLYGKGVVFKISTHILLQESVEIINNLVDFKTNSRFFGMAMELDIPFHERIITSDLGLASRINKNKYYKVENLKTKNSDSIRGQELCERLLNQIDHL